MQEQNMNSQVIRIPVVIGRNRIRGNGEGAMVFDDFGQENLDRLRSVISMEAKLQGLEPEPKWLSMSVGQLLKTYESAYRAWQEEKGGCIGFIYECSMPSGQVILLGDQKILERLSIMGEGNHVSTH